MSILTIIAARLRTLTPGERAIGEAILADPETVMRLPSQELARRAGRSQSGVIKFCHKLGLKGYQELCLEIGRATPHPRAGSALTVHGTIEAGDDVALTAQKLIAGKTDAVTKTLSVNAPEQIDAARDLLARARRIQLVGVGASTLVARDLAYKLQKLGLLASFDADSHIQMANAAVSSPQDAIVAISQSGTSLETLRIAQAAVGRGAHLVSITGLHPNPLRQGAELALFTVEEEERVRSSAITSRDAQLMITDLLFLRLVQILPEAAERIANAAEAIVPLKL